MMIKKREKDAYEIFNEAKENLPGLVKNHFYPPMTLNRSRTINMIIDVNYANQVRNRLNSQYVPGAIHDPTAPISARWKNKIAHDQDFSSDAEDASRAIARFIKRWYKAFFNPPGSPKPRQNTPANVTSQIDFSYKKLFSEAILNNPDSFANIDSFLYLLSILDSKQFKHHFYFPNFDSTAVEKLETIQLWYMYSTREDAVALFPKYKLMHSFYEEFFSTQLFNFFIKPNHGNNNFRKDFFEKRHPLFSTSSTKRYYEIISNSAFRDASVHLYNPYFSPINFFSESPRIIDKYKKMVVQPKSTRLKSKPLNMFHYDWNIRLDRLEDLRINNKRNKITLVSSDVDSMLKLTPLLEIDDLDKFFFSTYKKFLETDFTPNSSKNFELTTHLDSSFYIGVVARFWYQKDYKLMKDFSTIHTNFLPRMIKSSSDRSTARDYYSRLFFEMNNEINSVLRKPHFHVRDLPAIRRLVSPVDTIHFNPTFRTFFQPRQRYTPFISRRKKKKSFRQYFDTKNVSGYRPDGFFSNNTNEIYFMKFNPSNSFHAEYSKKILNLSKSYDPFSSQHARRHIHFRRHFDLIKLGEDAPLFTFNSTLNKYLRDKPQHHKRGKTHLKNRIGRDKYNFSKDSREVPKISDNLIFLWFQDVGRQISAFFVKIFVKPISEVFFLGILKDNFFSWLVISALFFFYDYTFVIVQVYFPAFWSLFDYNFIVFKSFSFYNFLIFSTFTSLLLSFWYIFFHVFPKPGFFFSSILKINLSFFIFITFMFSTFYSTPLGLAVAKIFSILFFVFFFIFRLFSPLFRNFPSIFDQFLPFPKPNQIFGYYNEHFFLQTWPVRFKYFLTSLNFQRRLYSVSFIPSFFFVKFKKLKRFPKFRFLVNPVHLSISAPVFGPNASFSASLDREQHDNYIPPNLKAINYLDEFGDVHEYDNNEQSVILRDLLELELRENVQEKPTHLRHDRQITTFPQHDNLEYNNLMRSDNLESSPINVENTSLSSTGYWHQFYVLENAKPFLPYYSFSTVKTPYSNLFKTNTLGAFLYSLSPTQFFKKLIFSKVNSFLKVQNYSFFSFQIVTIFFINLFFNFVGYLFQIVRSIFTLRKNFQFFRTLLWWFNVFHLFIRVFLFTDMLTPVYVRLTFSLYLKFIRRVRAELMQSLSFFNFIFHVFVFVIFSFFLTFISVSFQKPLMFKRFCKRVLKTSRSIAFFYIFNFFK